MRALLSLCFCLIVAWALAGCATTTSIDSRAAASGTYAVATLAPWGTFEHEVAPAYTRLALARRTAVRGLETHRMSVDQARAVQAAADRARAGLDAARAHADAGDPVLARRALAVALAGVDATEQLARGGSP